MIAAENKSLLCTAFDGLAKADATAFLDLMADDFSWIVEGQSKWSLRFEGKAAVQRDLIRPLFANFATPYRNFAEEMIAEGDRVVVLCRGEVKTRAGEDYNNSYCFVIRMRGGKMVELREYMDTALAEARLTMDAAE
ncbi:MAG TPA: nuclear transport factor 2 family protein [Sphingomicrobium sp.]|nr:nuclear transport factor 2 family protein [Sphingomicrobium sp.]